MLVINCFICCFVVQGDPNNDNWVRVELPLNSPVNFGVQFVGTMGTGEKGDIAIDDVSFSDGCEVGGKLVKKLLEKASLKSV